MKERNSLSVVALVATILSCSSSGPGVHGSTSLRIESADTAQGIPVPVPTDWLGYRLGLKTPRLIPVDTLKVVTTPPPDMTPTSASSPVPSAMTPAAPEDNELMYASSDGREYKMVFPEEDAQEIGDYYRSIGKTGGWAPPGATQPNVEKGWVDGVDHRVRWTYSSSDWPRDTMGALIYSDGTVGCTATLFSSQLVATAAHCIFGCNNTLNLPSKFAAGMDGTTIPYTEESINGYWYQTAYRTNNCNACTVNSTCTPYDIAFLSLGGRIGQTTGWMGWYWASSDSTVAGWTQFNMGYPECSQCGAPSGCVQNSMWGDWGSCGMGSFFDPVNGVNRNYKFGCDTSAGHSGGPLYTWAPNGCSSFPCIVGIDLAQDCCGSACSNTASTPNTAYRIVQTDSNVMASLQSMFP